MSDIELNEQDEKWFKDIGVEITQGKSPTEITREIIERLGDTSPELQGRLLEHAKRAEQGDECCTLQFELINLSEEPEIREKVDDYRDGLFSDMVMDIATCHPNFALPAFLLHKELMILAGMAYMLGRYDERKA